MGRSRLRDLDDGIGSPVSDLAVADRSLVRHRGRPRLIDGPGITVSVWIPTTVYDLLAVRADRRKQSISAYLRDVLSLLAGVRPDAFPIK
jgi:hypothetical protein